ncbi:hypothetical protein FDECE_7669 [Fusarium decemcellulare]|nr:hypothetical protein FDECE_7669 [Fusarium decemcellulare]
MRLFQIVRAALPVLLIHTARAKKPTIKSETIQADITEAKLFTHLEALNNIAQDEGDGDRAFGLPGYGASVDYVWSHIANIPGTTAWKQEFSAWFGQVKSISLKVDGKNVHVLPLIYSPSTPKDGITAELVLGPEDEAGCDPASYENLNVTGKIVLTRRFECPRGGKMASRVRPAAQNGAAAVIIYHDFTREPVSDTLGDYDPNGFVPAGYIRYASGISLKDRIESGETVVATFQHTQLYEKRTTENLLVETDEGDPENVIILGAHLDSVQGSPGINDNASGVSAILEVFKALTKYSFKNKVRFAWWGAMENGRMGSRYYCNNLASAEVDNILAYLNFDIIAKGYVGISDSDGKAWGTVAPPGSQVIRDIWVRHFSGQDTTPVRFDNVSDYASFWQILNKPIGFLHTGIDEQDECNHLACDDVDNPNPGLLEFNAKGIAHMVSVLSMRGHVLIPS